MKFDEGTSRRINPRTRNASVPVSKGLSRRRDTRIKEKKRNAIPKFYSETWRIERIVIHHDLPPLSFPFYGETVSKEGRKEGRKRIQVAESPATFRCFVRVGRCRITGFSTGQFVPLLFTLLLRAIEKVEEASHGTRDERLGIILPSLTYQPRIFLSPDTEALPA